MADSLTEQIIGAAIEVHRILGRGLLESIYEEALCVEFDLRGIPYELINFNAPRLIDGIRRISA